MDFTVSRPGQVNGAGDAKALFYKKFSGEVMTAFEERNVFMPLHMVRTISSGKSAAFPIHGKATSSYHTPGTEINGQNILGNEQIISIDSLLVSPVFVANIDEAMSEYSYRSIYSNECGNELANAFDKRAAKVVVLTARGASPVTGGNGGSVLNSNASVNTNDVALASQIFAAAQKLDEKDIPENDRVAVVRPAQYYLLVQGTTVINRDWGGSGSYADGKVLKVANVSILKSNHIPSSNTNAAASGENNTYFGDFSKTTAVVFQKRAFGTVKLLDLAVESEYSVRHQGTLLVAKYALGTAPLRPECAVEIATP